MYNEGKPVHKKLTVIGNSLGLVIEKPILDLLNIDRDTELEVRTDGVGLTIRPVQSDRKARIREAAGRAMDKHDKTFRKLAK
jgi:antitoxin component of MazEF toxin-antitoxin module